jgi:hypothetical protein
VKIFCVNSSKYAFCMDLYGLLNFEINGFCLAKKKGVILFP